MIDAKGLFWDQANWGPGYEISFEMFIHSYGVGNSKGYFPISSNGRQKEVRKTLFSLWQKDSQKLFLFHIR